MLADLAIMCAGGATTTVYPTTQHEDVSFILADSGSKVIFAEDDLQVAKVLDHLHELSEVAKIVQISGKVEHELVIGWDDFHALGREYLAANPDAVDAAIAATGPDTLATLIYTSGTTGRPKGVRLVHDSWTYEGMAIEVLRHHRPRRPAVPVAAAEPRVRQGLDRHPAADRLQHGHRRSDRQDRRQPRRREADVHGRRAADLREGAGQGDDGRRATA